MKSANIFLFLFLVVALTIFSCQKDNSVLSDTSDSQTTTTLEYSNSPQVRLVMNPSSIESLSADLPAFDLERFRATHRPINIFEAFQIEEEDLVYFMDEEVEGVDSRTTVVLEAGSVDGLADAIDEAGEGGKVVVETGTHYESARVVISEEVRIIGQPGAIIESSASDNMPALHVKDAEDVKIQGIELVSTGSSGTMGLLIEDSEETKVKNNSFLGFDRSIAIEQSEESKIIENTIVGSGANHGFININGEDTKVMGNEVSNCVFGSWLCDEGGKYKYNTTHSNFIGMILCKVPAGAFPLPEGGSTGSAQKILEMSGMLNIMHLMTIPGAI
jgi:nitrous oxidase accessory protein NosD